jgi:beta-xylosidase
MYGTGLTQGGQGFEVHKSCDLTNWSEPSVVFKNSDTFWAERDFWAPEVHYYKGKFYMFASFKSQARCRGTQILVSDTPDGTFSPLTTEPVTPIDWECLDGTLYIDKKGKPYIVFCHEWLQIKDGTICAVALSDDLTKPVSEPIKLFAASGASWTHTDNYKKTGNIVTDGPFLYRLKNGTLICLWASFNNHGYAQTYARSDNGEIDGAWTTDIPPIYSGDSGHGDGGHGMIFTALDGKLMLTLHTPNGGGNERAAIFPIEETADGIRLI